MIAGAQSMTTKEKLEDLKKYMKKTAFNQFDLEHLRNVHFADNKKLRHLLTLPNYRKYMGECHHLVEIQGRLYEKLLREENK